MRGKSSSLAIGAVRHSTVDVAVVGAVMAM
jgi:hypothetical protein